MVRSAEHGQKPRLETATAECSFCGRAESAANTLVASGAVGICAWCVSECAAILEEPARHRRGPPFARLPAPRRIHAFLDRYVVGQERVKRSVSVAVYNHYKRLRHVRAPGEPRIAKSNVLLLGPSGSGKTLIAESLARMLEVPFVSIDATGLSEAGYVGEDVEVIGERLLQAAEGDVERAAGGIVYIDEIDKLAARGDSPGHARDVSGEGVQQALLRFLEGARVPMPQARRSPRAAVPELDTREVLFLCGGAFSGLAATVERRRSCSGIGFAAAPEAAAGTSADLSEALTDDDLIEYGLIPELVGRLAVTCVLEPLDEAALRRVLTEPRNALVGQYRALLEMDGCHLAFTTPALTAIAREALATGTGARALRGVLERVLLEPMYAAAPGELVIDADTVTRSREAAGLCRVG